MIDIQNLSLEELDALCRPIALTTTRALLRGLPPEDAEECANDVMLRILSHREDYNPARGSLETYVRVVARSAALSRRRRMPPPSLPLIEELYITKDQKSTSAISWKRSSPAWASGNEASLPSASCMEWTAEKPPAD